MRGENFVAHLDGVGGTPVAHHCSRAMSDQISIDVTTYLVPYAYVVPIDFSRQVKRSLIRKQDAWKEAWIHVDPMQHVHSEFLWCGLSSGFSSFGPFAQNSMQRLRGTYSSLDAWGIHSVRLLWYAWRICSTFSSDTRVLPDCMWTLPFAILSCYALMAFLSCASSP
jgi:hypothetical protein